MAPARNLILVYTPTTFDPRDFSEIKSIIRSLAPDIEVFVTSNDENDATTRNRASHRPTLVYSPMVLRKFSPRRGKIYCGRVIPKAEQMRRLEAGGVAVPKWTLLGPDTTLDEAEWGPLVVVKPSIWGASYGKGIRLMRTSRVQYQAPQDLPADHPGKHAPMIVQRFVETGRSPVKTRILSIFGKVLYAMKRAATDDFPALDSSPDEIIERARVISSGKANSEFVYDERVHQVAAKCHAAMPSVPLQGIDILPGLDGIWYGLEINPGGNTWHFSSKQRAGYERELGGQKLTSQFDAFTVAAKTLIAKTRSEAE